MIHLLSYNDFSTFPILLGAGVPRSVANNPLILDAHNYHKKLIPRFYPIPTGNIVVEPNLCMNRKDNIADSHIEGNS